MNTPFLDTARRVIRCESEALTLLADSLDDRFRAAVDLMRACKGRVLVTGIGGTGVVTVGAILSMAAHLEGKGTSELDVTGLAQKNGPVMSHVRIALSLIHI